MKRKHEENSC